MRFALDILLQRFDVDHSTYAHAFAALKSQLAKFDVYYDGRTGTSCPADVILIRSRQPEAKHGEAAPTTRPKIPNSIL